MHSPQAQCGADWLHEVIGITHGEIDMKAKRISAAAAATLFAALVTKQAYAEQNFKLSGSSCHPTTPKAAGPVRWLTEGLENTSSSNDYWVQCPVLKFGSAQTFSVRVNFQNDSELEVEVRCNLREYKQGKRIKGMAGSILIPPGAFSSDMVWSGGFSGDSHVNVACRLPAKVSLESVESEASGGANTDNGRPPEIYLKSNGEPVAIMPLWAYDTAVTEEGYWFRSVPFTSAVRTTADLTFLDVSWSKTYLGNDPECQGQAFGKDLRMPVDDYAQVGLLYNDRETGSVLYGNFSESRVVSLYYTKNGSACNGPYESGSGLSVLPLYENDPAVTGWRLGTIIPNPSLGY